VAIRVFVLAPLPRISGISEVDRTAQFLFPLGMSRKLRAIVGYQSANQRVAQRSFQDSLGYPVKLRFFNRRSSQRQVEFADGGDEHGQGGEAVGDADAEEYAERFSQQEGGNRVEGAEREDSGCQC